MRTPETDKNETDQIAAFDLHPTAIVALGAPAQPVERMMATQAAIGRLVDLLCRLPALLSFNLRTPLNPVLRPGRAQPGDLR